MATTLRIKPDLYSQVRVGLILGIPREAVAPIAGSLNLAWKSASRSSRMLAREDIDRMADFLGREPDWDAAEPN